MYLCRPRVGDSVPDGVEVTTDEAMDSLVNFVEFADCVLHPGVHQSPNLTRVE